MTKLVRIAAGALAGCLVTAPAMATIEIGDVRLSGYLRQYVSMNLEDVPETSEDDEYDLSMIRSTFFLNAFAPVGQTNWTARFRASKDFQTDYEKRLEDIADSIIPGQDFEDEYDEVDLRELFVEFDLGSRINARLGRQQVVWGETDFFHATDVIHGYDFRWRSFYVPENEDTRKPLILANVNFDVPELQGSLQVVVRPGGLDEDSWIGNSVPAFGGRWSNNDSKGVPLGSQDENPSIATFDYHDEEGDTDDTHWGLRWSGTIGADLVNYSLSYYKGQGGFQQDPVLYFDAEDDIRLEFIFPETETYGASATGYIPFLDTVYRAEVAFTPDRTLGTLAGALVEKDAYNFLLGFDTNLRLQNTIFNTSSPSLFTVQLFDWYLPGVEESDQIVHFIGAGFYDEHNVLSTLIWTFPYMQDTLTATFVTIADLTQGGAWIVPSVEKQFGEHWRVKMEADFAVGGNQTDESRSFAGGDAASPVGAFTNNNQLLLRLTYQF